MKIDPAGNKPGVLKSNSETGQVPVSETFEETLNRHLDKTRQKHTPQTNRPSNVGGYPMTELARDQFLRADSVKKAEGLLFSLEMYQNSLANQAIKIERLSSLLADMREKSVEALKTAQKLPEGDQLHEILSEVRAVISNEERRFFL